MTNKSLVAVAVIFLVIGLVAGYLIPKPVEKVTIQPQLVNVEDRYKQALENSFGDKAKFTVITSIPTGSIELFRFDEIASHMHPDENHFLYILKGRASGNVGTVQGEVGPGTLVVIPAGVPHGFKKIGDEPVDLILFSSPPFKVGDTNWLGK